jgi:Flp pilus assembly protein TadG
MNGVSRGNTGRRLSICATLLVAVIAASAENQPAGPDAKAASTPAKNLTTMSVNITPNGSVPAHATCTWTATVSGGVSPYHYAWTVNNASVGFDSQFLQYTNTGSPFRVLVNVTDQNGDFASDSNIMTIGGTFC